MYHSQKATRLAALIWAPTPEGKQDFDAEQMYTLEAGAKGALLDDRLQMSAAVFHNVRPDQQVRSATQLVPGDPASFVFFTDNVGEGDALGLEADVRYLINDAWEFMRLWGYWMQALRAGASTRTRPALLSPQDCHTGALTGCSHGLI